MDPEAEPPIPGDPAFRPESGDEAADEQPGGADRANGDARGRSLAGRIFSTGSRGAQRFADISGLDEAIESAVEEAIVRSIESEATENAIARVINGPLVEQAVAEAMASESVEKAIVEALDSEMAERVWDHVLDGPHTQRLIERIAESPEVRSAIAAQGIGLVGDLGYQVSKVTRILDFIGERIARRLLWRPKRSQATSRVGFFTRVLALGIDALIVNFSLVLLAAAVSALGNALGITSDGVNPSLFAVGASIWFIFSSLYLYVFWSLSGQTPGMRFLDIRIEKDGDHRIGSRAARRRLLGFWLSALALGIPFLGVLIRVDRRGFLDRMGDTVVYFIDPTDPDAPHEKPEIWKRSGVAA